MKAKALSRSVLHAKRMNETKKMTGRLHIIRQITKLLFTLLSTQFVINIFSIGQG